MLTACKEGGAGGGDTKAIPDNGLLPDNGIQQPASPTPTPTPTPVTDHSNRNPEYGTVPTLADCVMLASWVPGINETWMFGTAQAGGGVSQASADAYNAGQFFRFDRDGIVWRHWDGTRWVNNFLSYQIAYLGNDCDVEIMGSLSGIGRVWWQGVEL